jgi:hypothetical protein
MIAAGMHGIASERQPGFRGLHVTFEEILMRLFNAALGDATGRAEGAKR